MVLLPEKGAAPIGVWGMVSETVCIARSIVLPEVAVMFGLALQNFILRIFSQLTLLPSSAASAFKSRSALNMFGNGSVCLPGSH